MKGETLRIAGGRRGRWAGLLSVLFGVVFGVAVTVVGLASANKLRPPQDPEVLVALGQLLETEHLRVDLLLEKGDVQGAIAALEELTGTQWPTRARGGDASVLLRHDLYGRLLRMRLDHPEVDPKSPGALLKMAEVGLGTEYDQLDPNPFTARLVGIRAELLEASGRDDEALLMYEEALDMNRTVLDELMGEQP